ncbi:right-handed parallel beta-helix repeat-containing protein [Luedemannella helvata]
MPASYPSGSYPQVPPGPPSTGSYPQVPAVSQPSGSYPQVPAVSQPSGAYPQVPVSPSSTGSYRQVPPGSSSTGSYRQVPAGSTGSYRQVPPGSSSTGSYRQVPAGSTGSYRQVPPASGQPRVARAAVVGGVALVTVAVTAMVVTVFNVVTEPDLTQVTAPTTAAVASDAGSAAPPTASASAAPPTSAAGTSASLPSPTPPKLDQATVKGFPSEANTGWQHTGVTLTQYRGPDEITRDGTVIEGMDMGCMFIRAKNVVIKKSRVRCSGPYPVRVESPATLWIEDTEVDGRGSYEALCIAAENYTALRVNCHGVGDGMRAGSNVTIQDSYIHDLKTCGDCHNDGIQSTGGSNIVIRHNHIDNRYSQTSCVLLGEEFAPLRNVLVENNLFNGGGYSLYGGGDTDRVSGIKIIGNRFKRAAGGGHFANGGSYGPAAHFDPGRPGNEWRNNVWDDNGRPVGY